MKNTFLNWLIQSSADPVKYSATIKGMLIQYLSLVLGVLAVFNVPLTNTQAYHFIDLATLGLGTALGMFGLARKFYYEVKNANAVE